jgi:hypothetical protein
MLIETIKKYPDDKHFVYSAFHEDGDMVDTEPRNFESIDYVGYVDYGAGGPSSGKKSAAIISGSNEVTSVVKAYNDVSNDAGEDTRSHPTQKQRRYRFEVGKTSMCSTLL